MSHLLPILDKAFQGRKVKPSQCISENSDAHFLIEDDLITKICVFKDPSSLTEEEIGQSFFSVFNASAQVVYLWAIDGCFMSPGVGTRCDCAIFTDREMCFIEFKLNAQTEHPLSIMEHRKKASGQLIATIDLVFNSLKLRSLSIDNVRFEAYICSPPKWPSKDTSLQDERISFLETYGIMLFEDNKKHFD